MRTTLHTYNFDTDKADEAANYRAMVVELKRQGLKVMESCSGNLTEDNTFYFDRIRPLDGQTVELETEHLFDNQWNTAPTETSESGLRLIDWHQSYLPDNRKQKRGYWLEQTDEMREIRRNTLVCGYCGHYEPSAKGYVFCEKCLGSPYLKEGELYMLRLMPVDKGLWGGEREPLTDAEKAHLMPMYIEKQVTRRKADAEKVKADLYKRYEKERDLADTEYNGMIWLLDRDINTENCIFYGHKNEFCFGWRAPLAVDAELALREKLADFPYDYAVKVSS